MEEFVAEFKFQASLHTDSDDCVMAIRGSIIRINDGKRSKVCTVDAIKIDIERAIDEDLDVYGALVYKHDDAYDALDAIYVDSEVAQYREEVIKMWPDCYGKGLGILVITKVISSRQYTDTHIEVPAIYRTIKQNYQGCSLVILCAESLSQTMRQYALLLGFKDLPDPKFLVFNTVVPGPDFDNIFNYDLLDLL